MPKKPLELARVVWSHRPLAGKVRRGQSCYILCARGPRAQVRFEDGTVAIVPIGTMRAPRKEVDRG
jgi:hypothetical protein